MKRVAFIVSILSLLILISHRATAQRVALDERIPKIKCSHWLDNKQPQKSNYTYIEFAHSRTVPCLRTFLKMQDDNAIFGENMRAIIITKESPEQISKTLRESVTDYVNVAFDTNGEIFKQFGVRYVPFGIIIDHKRRALWFGNPATLNEDFFSKIKPTNNDTH
jgi:hypothetical protein